MGGIVGRLFREVGVTVSVAIVLSAIIALTLSQTMAAFVRKNSMVERGAVSTPGASGLSRRS
jgi:multidrug efflux pump subunit AcrB